MPSTTPYQMQYDSGNVTVAATSTTVVDWTTGGLLDKFTFEVTTTVQALNTWIVKLKPHMDASYDSYLGQTDFDLPTANMIFCSAAGPHELSAPGAALVVIRLHYAHAVQMIATAAVAGAIVRVRGVGSAA